MELSDLFHAQDYKADSVSEDTQDDIGTILTSFFESKYGIRTKKYMICERTDQVPQDLLAQYIEFLNKNGARFLKVLSQSEDIAIIQYVDNLYTHRKTFDKEYFNIFRKYLDEHDGFLVSVKNAYWGTNAWENEKSIPYVKKETRYYSYFCFEAKYASIVAKIVYQKYGFAVEIFNINSLPGIAYMVCESESIESRIYGATADERPGIWAFLTQKYIPVIQIDDIMGKIKIRYKAQTLLESTEYRQGIRLDLGHMARSSWEANIARVFKRLGISYEYEREVLNLDDICYTPDFFLQNNVIVEVKGFWNDESRKKVAALEKHHPEYSVLPIDADMYESIRRKFADQIPEWEDNTPVGRETYAVSIIGMKFCAGTETLQALKIGDELILQRESDNSFDRNAILAKTTDDSPVGHVCADWAAVFAPKMDVGMTYHAEISDIQRSAIRVRVRRSNYEEDILYDFFK